MRGDKFRLLFTVMSCLLLVVSGTGVFEITTGYYEAKIDQLNNDWEGKYFSAQVELSNNAIILNADKEIIAQKEAEIQSIGDAATKYIQELEARPPKTVEVIKEVPIQAVNPTTVIIKEAAYFPDKSMLTKWLSDHIISGISNSNQCTTWAYFLVDLARQDGYVLETEQLGGTEYRAIYGEFLPLDYVHVVVKGKTIKENVLYFIDPQHENKIIYQEKLGG